MTRPDRADIINIGPPRFYLGGPPEGELRAAVFPEPRQMTALARAELDEALAMIAANEPHGGRAPKAAAAPETTDHWQAAMEALSEALSTGRTSGPARDTDMRPRRSPVIRQSRGGYGR